MSDDLQRDIGRMEAELAALKEAVDEIRKDLKIIKESFDEVKGGSRVFMGAAAILGSVVTIGLNWLLGKH